MEAKQAPKLRPNPGEYLTDGEHALYCFEAYLSDAAVLLEDCRTGEKVCWDLDEFLGKGLKVLDRLTGADGESAS